MLLKTRKVRKKCINFKLFVFDSLTVRRISLLLASVNIRYTTNLCLNTYAMAKELSFISLVLMHTNQSVSAVLNRFSFVNISCQILVSVSIRKQ